MMLIFKKDGAGKDSQVDSKTTAEKGGEKKQSGERVAALGCAVRGINVKTTQT